MKRRKSALRYIDSAIAYPGMPAVSKQQPIIRLTKQDEDMIEIIAALASESEIVTISTAGDNSPAAFKQSMKEVVAYKPGRTFKELLETTGIPKTSLFRALKKLIQRGEVEGRINKETIDRSKGRLDPVYCYIGQKAFQEIPPPTEGLHFRLYINKKTRCPEYLEELKAVRKGKGGKRESDFEHPPGSGKYYYWRRVGKIEKLEA